MALVARNRTLAAKLMLQGMRAQEVSPPREIVANMLLEEEGQLVIQGSPPTYRGEYNQTPSVPHAARPQATPRATPRARATFDLRGGDRSHNVVEQGIPGEDAAAAKRKAASQGCIQL